jgi:hypothetical protein
MGLLTGGGGYTRSLDRPVRNLDRSIRDLDRSIRDLDQSIRNLDESIRNMCLLCTCAFSSAAWIQASSESTILISRVARTEAKAVSYKDVAYAITFAKWHNIDDPYRNIHPTPPHPMRGGGGAWGGVGRMDIAIGVINVMPYCKCYGISNMLV